MSYSLSFSPKQYFFILGSIILTIICLYYASGFLIPFSFSLLITFILIQPVAWLEKKRIPSVLAIILVFLAVIGIVLGITYFFSSQIAILVSDFNKFQGNFSNLLNLAIDKYNDEFNYLPHIDENLVSNKVKNFIQNSGGSILSTTFTETSSFFANAFLVPVYVFLLLLYRKGLKKGITYFFYPEKRPLVEDILHDIQSVGKSYITGLSIVILILAVINSTALLIIGVDYAIMFGCLAALLIILPYIGTYLGGALPVMYALVTMDTTSALFVLISFVVIQAIEGNILTPKIVGSNTSVNPLTAFIALIVGGYIWGIAGMILSIPYIAMLKKIFRHVSGLQPLALLMGEELYESDIEVPDYNNYVMNKKEIDNGKLSLFRKLKMLLYHYLSNKD